MSEHEAMRDPADEAYATAEDMLADVAARAARRAAVLDAVAGERTAKTPPTQVPPSDARRYGGWLTAACVAGAGAFFAFQFAPPLAVREAAAPVKQATSSAPVAAPLGDAAATSASVEVASPPAQPAAPVAAAPPPPAPVAPPAPRLRQEPRPQSTLPSAAPDAPQPSAFPAAEEMAGRTDTARPAPPPAAAPVLARSVNGQTAPPSSASLAARLRAAANAGRISELRSLLAEGVAVDAPDAAGETALMKAVQARRPAAAALLLSHGADPDRASRAGVSARNLAQALGDPAFNRASGLTP